MDTKINNIRWEFDNGNGYYAFEFGNVTCRIRDNNNIPLLGDNQESRDYIMDRYWYILMSIK